MTKGRLKMISDDLCYLLMCKLYGFGLFGFWIDGVLKVLK